MTSTRTVRLDGPFTHSVTAREDDDWSQMRAWCLEQFGPEGNGYTGRYQGDTRWVCVLTRDGDFEVMFRDVKDAIHFKLRWGGH